MIITCVATFVDRLGFILVMGFVLVVLYCLYIIHSILEHRAGSFLATPGM
jgi:hypothetical protein